MVEGFSERVVDTDASVKTNTVAVDGIQFFLAVVRDEKGTQVVVDATESKPGYQNSDGTFDGTGATLTIHTKPYDPQL